MKKIIVGVGAAALLLTGCSSTTSAPPRTSTTSTSAEQPSAPVSSSTTVDTPEPTNTTEQPGLPQELDFDLEGDPCEGVASVDIDDKHYECVDGVFRS